MSDTTKDVEETPPGYPEGWQPEEIRTIEPQPLPKEQQPDPVLTPEQATEWNRLQSLYPHDPVAIEWDDDDEPTFITPDGEDHPLDTPKAAAKSDETGTYEDLTKAELVEEIHNRNDAGAQIPVSGTKEELMTYLEEDDAEAKADTKK